MHFADFAWVRRLARWLAPAGTRRRALILWARARYGWFLDAPPFRDPLSRRELNRLLIKAKARPVDAWPGEGGATATRRLVTFLLAHPDLARAFPAALDGDPDGGFGRWLDRSGIDPAVAGRFRESVAARPAAGPLHLFDCEPVLRAMYPLGLTPAQLPALTLWMLRDRWRSGLGEDEVLAFYLRWAVEPGFGVAASYLRQPAWQRAVPDALRGGWQELLGWLRRHYRIKGAWITQALPTGPDPDEPGAGPGVNLLAHFRYPSGLQVAALNTAAALRGAGVAVSARNVVVARKTDLPGLDGYLGLHPHPVTISQLAPEPLAEDAYELAGLARRPDTYRVGYWYWELEQVPAWWRRHASWLHELWAPTRFIGDALRAALPLPVVDMLAGMAMPPAVRLPRSRFGLPDGRFLFLFVFDMCSSMQRKNPLAVVESFRRAFAPREPVALAVKVSRGWHDPDGLERLRSACRDAGAHLIEATLSHEEVFGLMNAADAYVSLHRSEGYGLTLAESMALGKPAIATAYSGNLAFMNPRNSLLVDYTLTPLARSFGIYGKGGRWAEPSVDHAAQRMRWVFDNPQAARSLAERGRHEVRRTLSLEAAGRRMARRLEELARRRALASGASVLGLKPRAKKASPVPLPEPAAPISPERR